MIIELKIQTISQQSNHPNILPIPLIPTKVIYENDLLNLYYILIGKFLGEKHWRQI